MAMDRPCLLMGGGLQSQIQSNRLSTHGRVIVFAALCLGTLGLPVRLNGGSYGDRQTRIRQLVQPQRLTAALLIAEGQLAGQPDDLEGRGWRARSLAWTQRWNESEIEYQAVLQSAPHHMGLADLVIWQERSDEVIPLLDLVTALDSSRSNVQLPCGRVLRVLGRRAEAGATYSRLLSWSGLFAGVRSESRASMNPSSVAEGDGNRSFAPLGFRQVDEPFHLDWQLRFIRGSTTEVDCRFYLRFGQALIRWDVANQPRPFLESRLDGRPQTLNGKNYAVRF